MSYKCITSINFDKSKKKVQVEKSGYTELKLGHEEVYLSVQK